MQNKKEVLRQGLAPAVKKALSLLLAMVMLLSITAGIDLSVYASDTINLTLKVTRNYNFSNSILELVNKERAKVGADKLVMDETLLECAMQRAGEISTYYSHQRPDGSNFSTINSLAVGENIAAGYGNPTAVMNGWMNSSGHKANILKNSYKSIGIGCVFHNGAWYWVQNFGTGMSNEFSKTNTHDVKQTINISKENIKLVCNYIEVDYTDDSIYNEIDENSINRTFEYSKYPNGFRPLVEGGNVGSCSSGGIFTDFYDISSDSLVYSSNNEKIFTVDKNGIVHIVSTGKAIFKACLKDDPSIFVEKVISVTNNHSHSYDSGKVTKSATCSATGVKTYTCTKCKATKTETIAKTAHSYDSGKITKAATTTATGVKTYTCTKCKATKTETISKLKLTAPTLKVAVNSNGTFKMTWNKVSGAEKYEIYYKQVDGSYKLLKTVTGTSYTTVVAQYGKQYSYKMKAVKGSTKSDYSKVVNATNNKKLQTPTLKVAVNSNGTFKMTWNKVTGATSYQIYWKQTDGSYKLLKTVTGTSYTSGFAQYGKQYSYKVRAVTSKNSSATSNFSSVVNAKNMKKLGTPTMKATVNKNGSFKLSWGKVTGATSYQIYWKQANGSYKLLKTVTGTSYTTVVAAKGKTYNYKVRAVTKNNSSATSNYSSVVSAKRK